MGRTYQEILNELKSFVKQRWPGWNAEAKHIGNIILECLADQIEKQEYRLDAIEDELFPDTATKYESLLRWARMLGYEIQSARPADVSLTFSVASPAEADIVIPAGTKVVTAGPAPLPFITTEVVVIHAGQTSVSVTGRQAEQIEETFTGTGEASQVYQTSTGYIWADSLQVNVGGEQWSKVRDFLLSEGTDAHYTVELQDDGTALIMFGDGVNGKAPANGAEIIIRYETTRGADGNIPAGAIAAIDTVLYDANGFLADVRVTNESAASGGINQEDMNHLREAISAWITTTERCVTRNDFIDAAQAVAGVQRALVLTHDEDETISPLTVLVYIVPEGGGTPSEGLLNAVVTELTVNRPRMLTIVVDVQAAKYAFVDVNCTITVAPGHTGTTVRDAVKQAIIEFFDYGRTEDDNWAIDFGKPIYLAKLLGWIASVTGVANVVLSSPTADVTPGADTIPALGTVTVNVA